LGPLNLAHFVDDSLTGWVYKWSDSDMGMPVNASNSHSTAEFLTHPTVYQLLCAQAVIQLVEPVY